MVERRDDGFAYRFLVEEGERLQARDCVRWWRQASRELTRPQRKRWATALEEPYAEIPVDLETGVTIALYHRRCAHWQNAIHYYWMCPKCWAWCRYVLRLDQDDAWACRRCHRAKYASQWKRDDGYRRATQWCAANHELQWRLRQPGPRGRRVARLREIMDATAWTMDTHSGQFAKERWDAEWYGEDAA